ncbi:MAG: hypothetical protein HYR76_08610 [Ignavibacteria bacterium]|nr:hypothetical protein [Ignavibacteria bacterium]MBI3787579.1 hypothetical protein [Ignavibacteriales bacterium]
MKKREPYRSAIKPGHFVFQNVYKHHLPTFLQPAFIIVVLSLLLTLPSLSQVTIKEKLSIDSLSRKLEYFSKDGGDHGHKSIFASSQIFLECGGQVTLQPYSSFYQIVLLPSMDVVAQYPTPGEIITVGTYSAGTTLQFGYVLSDEDPPCVSIYHQPRQYWSISTDGAVLL